MAIRAAVCEADFDLDSETPSAVKKSNRMVMRKMLSCIFPHSKSPFDVPPLLGCDMFHFYFRITMISKYLDDIKVRSSFLPSNRVPNLLAVLPPQAKWKEFAASARCCTYHADCTLFKCIRYWAWNGRWPGTRWRDGNFQITHQSASIRRQSWSFWTPAVCSVQACSKCKFIFKVQVL